MEPFTLGPLPSSRTDEPLVLVVMDTFRIEGRGLITTATLRSGILRTGESVEVVRPDGQAVRVQVRGIEFVCGPRVRRDVVSFLLGSEADDFLVADAVIRAAPDECSAAR